MSPEPVWNDPEQEYRARRTRPGRGTRIGEAALLVFGVIVALGVAESGARLYRRSQPPKGGYSPVRGRRSREPLNSAGYRDVDHAKEKPPGVRRAVFVGDRPLDDIHGAQQAGMRAVLRPNPMVEGYDVTPDGVISSLPELLGLVDGWR